MSFLDQVEPLKESALAELRAAPDLAALEQARVSYLGTQRQVHRPDEAIGHAAEGGEAGGGQGR